MIRGALVVIEGVDRTGKSTQAKKLVESLKKNKISAEYTNFPMRSTEIGKVIDRYLTSDNDLPDEAIHLLFSANRWERASSIIKMLESGTSVIVDRYCYSGVVFSAAKGLNLKWCKSSDVGLPKPDKVFFLTMPLNSVQSRNGFGQERYEVLDFQRKVADMYMQLKEDNWDILDANRSIETIQEDLLEKTLQVVKQVECEPLGKIWTESELL